MPGVMDKLNSFTRRGSNKKLVSSGKYKFSVDTEKVLLLEKGNYKSLTFSILRDGPSNKFENLFLHPHKGGYLAFLMEADFDDFDRRNLDVGDPIAGLLSKLQFTPLNDFDMPGLDVEYTPTDNWTGNTYNYPGTVWEEDGICYTWHNYAAAGEPVDFRPIECPGCCPKNTGGGSPVNTSGPRLVWQQYLAIVDMIGSQGGSGSSGPGSGGSGSGGLFIPGDGFYTPFNPVKPEQVEPLNPQNEDFYHPNPIIGVVSPNRPQLQLSPCNTLNVLKNDPVIKNALNTLKGNVTQNNERLFTFSKNGSGETYATPETNNTGASASMRLTAATYGVAHTHQSGTNNNSNLYKMFSFTDLQVVYKLAKGYGGSGATAAPLFFNMMVIEGYTYIICPNNVNTFKNMGSIFENDKNVERLNFQLNTIYNKYCNSTEANAATISHESLARYLLMFLNNVGNNSKVLSGTNFDISLYRVSNDNNFSGGWEKMELDPNTNYQLKNPISCN